MQDDNPAESTAQEIKTAARDMLRMGSRWAHSALDWIDERRHEMNHHNRDERDYGERQRSEYSPSSASGHGDWQDRERHAQRQYGGRREQLQGRSDREIQGDYSGGGYDQVGGRGDWSRSSEYGQRPVYGREGSHVQSRTLSPDDDSLRGDYGSSYGSSGAGSSYGGAGYGYGASAPGGVGYGAPGYGAGSSYAESRYHGDFQSRGIGEEEGYGSYGREFGSRGEASEFGRDFGRLQGGRGQEGYGQSWREQRTYGSASQGYGARGFESQGLGSELGYGRAGQPYGDRSYRGYGSSGERSEQGSQRLQGYGGLGLQGTQSSQLGRNYRGVGPRNYTRSDERIREDLNERLTDAHDIDASMITVEVNNGVATLTGTVNERWMKHRAEDIADGCTGVNDVRNNIQVQPQSGSEFGRQSQGSPYGSSQQGLSGQGSMSGTQGSNLGTSTSASSQGSGLGTTGSASASQGSGTGPQGSGASRGSSPGSKGPNV